MNALSELPVVVLRSNDYSFLGILRSCHRENLNTISITFDWPNSPVWYSEHSNTFKEHYQISNPYTQELEAVEQLVTLGEEFFSRYHHKLMLIPSSDTNMMLIHKHYDVLAPYFAMIGDISFEKSRLDVISKDTCFELIEAHDAPCPKTLKCFTESDIELCLSQMNFPCIYKPAFKDYGQTFYRQHNGLKAIECSTPEELKKCLHTELKQGFKLVVQEKIVFNSVHDEIPAYLYFDKEQQVQLFTTGIKQSIYPHPFGTAIELELSSHEELLPLAQQVGQALKWRGMLMVEFIRDLKDKQWKVIEVNTRPWLMSDFYSRCGFNYTEYLFNDFIGAPLIFKQAKSSLLHRRPTHIDLYKVIEKARFTAEQLIDYLEKKNEMLSFTNFDISDPEPGYLEAKMIKKDFNIDEKVILSIYEKFGTSI
jgi:predicted ATP-grasp superfamily ATP-dependent carboligase